MALKVTGKVIKKVRSMTKSELIAENWKGGKALIIELEDGTKLYASRDPHGSGPGALFARDTDNKQYYIEP
jgi:hypothetical protein